MLAVRGWTFLAWWGVLGWGGWLEEMREGFLKREMGRDGDGGKLRWDSNHLHSVIGCDDWIVSVYQRAFAAGDGDCGLQAAALRTWRGRVGCIVHACYGVGCLVGILGRRGDVSFLYCSNSDCR
jgi:hypothetical protein